jgi:hypothetical protein
MKTRIFVIFGFCVLAIAARGQSINSAVYVRNFPGTTVGQMTANAMITCPQSPVPCILVLDPSLHSTPAGTMPTLCANCYLSDWRNGPPVSAGCGSSSPCSIPQGGTAAADVFDALANLNGATPLLTTQVANHPADNFDAPDGTLVQGRQTKNGFTWTLTGVGASTAEILGGAFVSPGGNLYAALEDTQVITAISGTYSFIPASGATAADTGTLIISCTNSISTGCLIHLVVTDHGVFPDLSVSTGASGLVPVNNCVSNVPFSVMNQTGSYAIHNTPWDGSKHTVWATVNWSAGILTYSGIDGATYTCTDSRISSMAPAYYPIWQLPQHTSGNAGFEWNAVWAGPAKSDVIASADVQGNLLLNELTAQKQITVVNATGDGSYLIATDNGLFPNRSMGGTITIYGIDGGGHTARFSDTFGIENQAGSSLTASSVSVNPPSVALGEFAGGIVPSLSLSTNNTTGASQLCMNVSSADASSATLVVVFDGTFVPVANPVVGCTDLASFAIPIVTAPPAGQTTSACSTSGTETYSEPFTGALYKKVIINLNAGDGTCIAYFPVAFAATPAVFFSNGIASSLTVGGLSTGDIVLYTSGAVTGVVTIEGY